MLLHVAFIHFTINDHLGDFQFLPDREYIDLCILEHIFWEPRHIFIF